MLIGFEIYRSKNNEVIEDSSIRVDIGDLLLNTKLEDDSFIVETLVVCQRATSEYLEQTEYVKKFGIGYVGNMKLRTIIFENNDNVPFAEQQILDEFKQKAPNVTVIWNKDIQLITEDRKIR